MADKYPIFDRIREFYGTDLPTERQVNDYYVNNIAEPLSRTGAKFLSPQEFYHNQIPPEAKIPVKKDFSELGFLKGKYTRLAGVTLANIGLDMKDSQEAISASEPIVKGMKLALRELEEIDSSFTDFMGSLDEKLLDKGHRLILDGNRQISHSDMSSVYGNDVPFWSEIYQGVVDVGLYQLPVGVLAGIGLVAGPGKLIKGAKALQKGSGGGVLNLTPSARYSALMARLGTKKLKNAGKLGRRAVGALPWSGIAVLENSHDAYQEIWNRTQDAEQALRGMNKKVRTIAPLYVAIDTFLGAQSLIIRNAGGAITDKIAKDTIAWLKRTMDDMGISQSVANKIINKGASITGGAVAGGFTEAIQEMLQELTSAYYNANIFGYENDYRSIAIDSFLLGGVLGAGIGAAGGAINSKRLSEAYEEFDKQIVEGAQMEQERIGNEVQNILSDLGKFKQDPNWKKNIKKIEDYNNEMQAVVKNGSPHDYDLVAKVYKDTRKLVEGMANILGPVKIRPEELYGGNIVKKDAYNKDKWKFYEDEINDALDDGQNDRAVMGVYMFYKDLEKETRQTDIHKDRVRQAVFSGEEDVGALVDGDLGEADNQFITEARGLYDAAPDKNVVGSLLTQTKAKPGNKYLAGVFNLGEQDKAEGQAAVGAEAKPNESGEIFQRLKQEYDEGDAGSIEGIIDSYENDDGEVTESVRANMRAVYDEGRKEIEAVDWAAVPEGERPAKFNEMWGELADKVSNSIDTTAEKTEGGTDTELDETREEPDEEVEAKETDSKKTAEAKDETKEEKPADEPAAETEQAKDDSKDAAKEPAVKEDTKKQTKKETAKKEGETAVEEGAVEEELTNKQIYTRLLKDHHHSVNGDIKDSYAMDKKHKAKEYIDYEAIEKGMREIWALGIDILENYDWKSVPANERKSTFENFWTDISFQVGSGVRPIWDKGVAAYNAAQQDKTKTAEPPKDTTNKETANKDTDKKTEGKQAEQTEEEPPVEEPAVEGETETEETAEAASEETEAEQDESEQEEGESDFDKAEDFDTALEALKKENAKPKKTSAKKTAAKTTRPKTPRKTQPAKPRKTPAKNTVSKKAKEEFNKALNDVFDVGDIKFALEDTKKANQDFVKKKEKEREENRRIKEWLSSEERLSEPTDKNSDAYKERNEEIYDQLAEDNGEIDLDYEYYDKDTADLNLTDSDVDHLRKLIRESLEESRDELSSYDWLSLPPDMRAEKYEELKENAYDKAVDEAGKEEDKLIAGNEELEREQEEYAEKLYKNRQEDAAEMLAEIHDLMGKKGYSEDDYSASVQDTGDSIYLEFLFEAIPEDGVKEIHRKVRLADHSNTSGFFDPRDVDSNLIYGKHGETIEDKRATQQGVGSSAYTETQETYGLWETDIEDDIKFLPNKSELKGEIKYALAEKKKLTIPPKLLPQFKKDQAAMLEVMKGVPDSQAEQRSKKLVALLKAKYVKLVKEHEQQEAKKNANIVPGKIVPVKENQREFKKADITKDADENAETGEFTEKYPGVEVADNPSRLTVPRWLLTVKAPFVSIKNLPKTIIGMAKAGWFFNEQLWIIGRMFRRFKQKQHVFIDNEIFTHLSKYFNHKLPKDWVAYNPARPDLNKEAELEINLGYLSGDGTGFGKTRVAAAAIAAELAEGGRAVAVAPASLINVESEEDTAYADRLHEEGGIDTDRIYTVDNVADIKKKDGKVLLVSYETLAAYNPNRNTRRMTDILKFMGEDFRGTIVFDESHMAPSPVRAQRKKGVLETKFNSSIGKAGQAAIYFQWRYPKAKVLYMSATHADEPSDLFVYQRLGLDGRGQKIRTTSNLIELTGNSNRGARLVLSELYHRGAFSSYGLSMKGAEIVEEIVSLSPKQIKLYDDIAGVIAQIDEKAFQIASLGDEEAVNNTDSDAQMDVVKQFHANHSGESRSMFKGILESALLRFYSNFLTYLSADITISKIKQQVKAGEQAVIFSNSTMEARLNAYINSRGLKGDSINLGKQGSQGAVSLRGLLEDAIKKYMPINKLELVQELGADGELEEAIQVSPEIDPDAKKIRDDFLEEISPILSQLPNEPPIDFIINSLKEDGISVGEITGRKRHLVRGKDGSLIAVSRKETKAAARDSFQGKGGHDVVLLSSAGGTGISLHAEAVNPKKRNMFILDFGFTPHTIIQALGRINRTNQKANPTYTFINLENLFSQSRLTAAIMNRMLILGAYTRGHSKTVLFTERHQLLDIYGRQALRDVLYVGAVPEETLIRMRYDKPNRDRMKSRDSGIRLEQFLNRLLSLDIETANQILGMIITRREDLIDIAKQKNEYVEDSMQRPGLMEANVEAQIGLKEPVGEEDIGTLYQVDTKHRYLLETWESIEELRKKEEMRWLAANVVPSYKLASYRDESGKLLREEVYLGRIHQGGGDSFLNPPNRERGNLRVNQEELLGETDMEITVTDEDGATRRVKVKRKFHDLTDADAKKKWNAEVDRIKNSSRNAKEYWVTGNLLDAAAELASDDFLFSPELYWSPVKHLNGEKDNEYYLLLRKKSHYEHLLHRFGNINFDDMKVESVPEFLKNNADSSLEAGGGFQISYNLVNKTFQLFKQGRNIQTFKTDDDLVDFIKKNNIAGGFKRNRQNVGMDNIKEILEKNKGAELSVVNAISDANGRKEMARELMQGRVIIDKSARYLIQYIKNRGVLRQVNLERGAEFTEHDVKTGVGTVSGGLNRLLQKIGLSAIDGVVVDESVIHKAMGANLDAPGMKFALAGRDGEGMSNKYLRQRFINEAERLSNLLNIKISLYDYGVKGITVNKTERVVAFFNPNNNSIGMVIDDKLTFREFQRKILHEAFGHFGFQIMREKGYDIDKELIKIAQSKDPKIAEEVEIVRELYKSLNLDDVGIGEEVVARLAEREIAVPALQRLINAIRGWFSRTFNMPVSYGVVLDMIRRNKINLQQRTEHDLASVTDKNIIKDLNDNYSKDMKRGIPGISEEVELIGDRILVTNSVTGEQIGSVDKHGKVNWHRGRKRPEYAKKMQKIAESVDEMARRKRMHGEDLVEYLPDLAPGTVSDPRYLDYVIQAGKNYIQGIAYPDYAIQDDTIREFVSAKPILQDNSEMLDKLEEYWEHHYSGLSHIRFLPNSSLQKSFGFVTPLQAVIFYNSFHSFNQAAEILDKAASFYSLSRVAGKDVIKYKTFSLEASEKERIRRYRQLGDKTLLKALTKKLGTATKAKDILSMAEARDDGVFSVELKHELTDVEKLSFAMAEGLLSPEQADRIGTFEAIATKLYKKGQSVSSVLLNHLTYTDEYSRALQSALRSEGIDIDMSSTETQMSALLRSNRVAVESYFSDILKSFKKSELDYLIPEMKRAGYVPTKYHQVSVEAQNKIERDNLELSRAEILRENNSPYNYISLMFYAAHTVSMRNKTEQRIKAIGDAKDKESLDLIKTYKKMQRTGMAFKSAQHIMRIVNSNSLLKEQFDKASGFLKAANDKVLDNLVRHGAENKETVEMYKGFYDLGNPYLALRGAEAPNLGPGNSNVLGGLMHRTGRTKRSHNVLTNTMNSWLKNITRAKKIRLLLEIARYAETERLMFPERRLKDLSVFLPRPDEKLTPAQEIRSIRFKVQGKELRLVFNNAKIHKEWDRIINKPLWVADTPAINRVIDMARAFTTFLKLTATAAGPQYLVNNMIRDYFETIAFKHGTLERLGVQFTPKLRDKLKDFAKYGADWQEGRKIVWLVTVKAPENFESDFRKDNIDWDNLGRYGKKFKARAEKIGVDNVKQFVHLYRHGGVIGLSHALGFHENEVLRANARLKETYGAIEKLDSAWVGGKEAGRNLITKPFQYMLDISSMFEYAPRYAMYKIAKESGLSDQHAINLAQEVTVNFARKGEWFSDRSGMGVVLSATELFFRVALIGTYRFASVIAQLHNLPQAGRHIDKGEYKKAMASLMHPSMAKNMLMYPALMFLTWKLGNEFVCDDDLEGTTGFESMRSLSICGGFKAPIPRTFSVPKFFAEITGDAMLSGLGYEVDPPDRMEQFSTMLTQAISPLPVGGYGGALGNAFFFTLPIGADWVGSIVSNINYFGSPIYPAEAYGYKPLDKSHAGWKSTPQFWKNWARFMSNNLNVDAYPETWRFTARYLLNDLYRFSEYYALTIADYAHSDEQLEKLKNISDNKVDVLRDAAIWFNDRSSDNRAFKDFFETDRDVKNKYNQYIDYRKGGFDKKARQFLEDHPNLIKDYRVWLGVSRGYNRSLRRIDPDWPKKKKDREKLKFIRLALDKWKEYEKK